MTAFYVMEPERGRFHPKWAYADIVDPLITGAAEHCPVCGGAVSLLRWLPPHRIRLSSAKPAKWGDFVWGAGFNLIVSERFKQVYEAEHLTGISVFHPSVQIVRVGIKKAGDLELTLPVYHLIDVPWGGAEQDDIASEVEYERPEKVSCSYCRVGVAWRKQSKLVIQESSWNGTDLFVARGAPAPFVTSERFKQVVDAYRLTNIRLIPAEAYGYDERRPGLWYVNK